MSTPGFTDGQQAFHTRALLLSTKLHTYAEYTDIQDHFNAGVGFVPRTGIRTTKLHFEPTPRPGGWIRVMEPMLVLTYTTDQDNRLITRRLHHMLGTRPKHGAYINLIYNRPKGMYRQGGHYRPDEVPARMARRDPSPANSGR